MAWGLLLRCQNHAQIPAGKCEITVIGSSSGWWSGFTNGMHCWSMKGKETASSFQVWAWNQKSSANAQADLSLHWARSYFVDIVMLRLIFKRNRNVSFQINFLVCQLVALAVGFPFRLLLNPRTTSPQVRHIVELLVGVALILFCFGR